MPIYYLDYENGSDSVTDTPLGWWSVVVSSPSGAQPAADETMTGASSGATANLTIAADAWSGTPTLYFYGKSGTFTSETVNFSGGGSATISSDLTYCAWKTITSGATAARIAPGDTIRIAKSPAPTSIGTGRWTTTTTTGGGFPATTAISGAADNGSGLVRLTVADSSSFVTDSVAQVLAVTGTCAPYVNGTWLCTVIDSTHIDLQGSAFSGSYTSGGTAQNITSKAVVLDAAQTLNIDNCDVAWTAAGSATVAAYDNVSTAVKEGYKVVRVIKSSPSNNTKYAYRTITTTDFSSYQKISFWIKNSTAIASENVWKICLCSDTAGATIVDTFYIPAIPSTGKFLPLTLTKDGGGNLGSAIKSIALYSGSAAATTSGIFLDHFIACTTGGVSLQSLISASPGELINEDYQESWHNIQSVDRSGKILLLDNYEFTPVNAGRGYSGTTQTVTTYKRETIKTEIASYSSSAVQATQEAGTSSSYITYDGGFDPATNTQTGETIFDGLNCYGSGIDASANSTSYVYFNKISATRYYIGINLYNQTFVGTIPLLCGNELGIQCGLSSEIDEIICANNNSYAISPAQGCTINKIYNTRNQFSGVGYAFSNTAYFRVKEIINIINTDHGIQIMSIGANTVANNKIGKITNLLYNGYGFYFYNSLEAKVTEVVNCSGNTQTVFAYGSLNRITNLTSSDSVVFDGASAFGGTALYVYQYGAVENTKYYYTDGGYITTSAITGGTKWVSYPTTGRIESYPLDFKLAQISCSSNRKIFISATVQKSHATDIASSIICEGGQIAGVTDDVTATKADDTNEEVLTISFTPTASGVVDIKFLVWWVANDADKNASLHTLFTNAREYGYVFLEDTQSIMDFDYILKYDTKTANPYITEATIGTVAAYTDFTIDHSTQTVTLNANTTVAKMYDYSQYDLTLDANLKYPTWLTTLDGVSFTSDYNIDLNGYTLSGGTSIDVGSMAFATNGGAYTGIVITASYGRLVPITLNNIVSGSRYYAYNTSTLEEVFSGEAASTTVNIYGIPWTEDYTIAGWVRNASGTPVYKSFPFQGTVTQNGVSFYISQEQE